MDRQRPSKVYGRRLGRPLKKGRQDKLDRLLPKYELGQDRLGAAFDPKPHFRVEVEEVWLEVGFGGGEHLAWQAQRNPQAGIIGAEYFINGVASLLTHVEEAGFENLLIYQDDATGLLEALAPNSISRAFLLFPDPWPKERHAKRRFIQSDTLDLLARALKEGAEFRFASDNPLYLRWALAQLLDHPCFQWTARGPDDWRKRPEDWPQTRYEAKALAGVPAFTSWRCVKSS